MDSTIIAAIIGAFSVLVAAIVTGIITRKQSDKPDDDYLPPAIPIVSLPYESVDLDDDISNLKPPILQPPRYVFETKIYVPETRELSEKIIANAYQSERLIMLLQKAKHFLEYLQYSEDIVRDFETIYHELTANGLEHGCPTLEDEIEITFEITYHYITLTVINLSREQFNISEILENKRKALSRNSNLPRGRGLLIAEEISDTFINISDLTGVKSIIERYRVELSIEKLLDNTIILITPTSGLENASFPRRMLQAANAYKGQHLIIFFGSLGVGSHPARLAANLMQLHSKFGKKILVVLDSRSDIPFRGDNVVDSMEDALRRIELDND